MRRFRSFLSILASTVLPLTALALPIDPSIDVTVKGSTYGISGTETLDDVLAAFNGATDLGCNGVSVTSVDLVSGPRNCGTRNRNLATDISIAFTGAAADWQFRVGADWGKGGALIIDNELQGLYRGDGDIWWAHNWNHGDVFSTNTFTLDAGSHSLRFIGFEGCCEGGTSIQFSYNNSDWQRVSLDSLNSIAEVPEPSSLALLGLGAYIALRRRKAN